MRSRDALCGLWLEVSRVALICWSWRAAGVLVSPAGADTRRYTSSRELQAVWRRPVSIAGSLMYRDHERVVVQDS
jgi:hypothetical protein